MSEGSVPAGSRRTALLMVALAFVAVVAIMIIASGPAAAKTVTITSDAKGKVGLLDKAIKDASPGDIIKLDFGVFIEGNLSINKSLTLVGDEESQLLAESIRVTADNFTFHSLSMSLTDGVLLVEGDNWTFNKAVMAECLGYTCVRVEKTQGGRVISSTFVGLAGDAFDVNASSGITFNGVYVYAPEAGMRLNNSNDIGFWDVRVAQATLGMYTSWCKDIRLAHSVFDTKGWGILSANTTDLSIRDSLLLSNSAYLENYGIYLAFDKNVSIMNNTFTADAAGIALWKSANITAVQNSIFGNYEGVWAWESELTLVDNALFNNIHYALNVTGYSPTAINNYWGTSSASEAKSIIRGAVTVEPIRTIDPTPDHAPTLLSSIPDITNGTEDASAETLLELGPYFGDDTWYIEAWTPRPSKVMFDIAYNSDPKNVTISVSEKGTCSGTCKDVEGELKVSTTSNWYGTIQVKIRARDWRGKSIESNLFKIKFSTVNDRPVINIQDVPKNSLIELKDGQSKAFNITVSDDSTSVWVEYRIDNGTWKAVSQTRACQWDNASKLKGLPRCTVDVYILNVDDEMDVGVHTLSFRSCDGQYCSDELYTGRYDVEVYNSGSSGKSFSPTGVSLALVLLVLIALVAVGISTSGSKKAQPEQDVPVRPKKVSRSDEEE